MINKGLKAISTTITSRVLLLLIASVFLSFADDSKNEINFLFYNLPLNTSTTAIKNKIKSDSNFTHVNYTRDHLLLRYLSATIKHPQTLSSQSDSASLQINLLSSLLYGNIGKRGPVLRSIEIKLFFKDETLQKKESDKIKEALSSSYKIKSNLEVVVMSSGPAGRDTVLENGLTFALDPVNQYPTLTLLRSISANKQRYLVLNYLGKNKN